MIKSPSNPLVEFIKILYYYHINSNFSIKNSYFKLLE